MSGAAYSAPGDPPTSFTEYASDFSESDLSMQLVQGIFGPAYTSMLSDGGINMDANASGRLLGQVSLVLNAAALALTGVLVVLTVFTGVLSTGHEGISLGRKYSTLWVPARISISLILLIPVAGGYSLGQAAVMLIGKAGAGVANTAFVYGYDYAVTNTGIVVDPQLHGVSQLAVQMLQSQVCAASMNQTRPGIINAATEGPTDGSGVWTLRYTSGSWSFGSDVCGRYSVGAAEQPSPISSMFIGSNSAQDGSEAAQLRQTMQAAHATALYQLAGDLSPVAGAIADGRSPSGDGFRRAISNYRDSVTAAAQQALSQARQNTEASTDADGAVTGRGTVLEEGSRQIKDLGWAAAGGFYWTITSFYSAIGDAITEVPSGRGPNTTRISTVGGREYEDVLAAINRAAEFARHEAVLSINDNSASMGAALALSQAASDGNDANRAIEGTLTRAFSDYETSLSVMVVDYLTESGDPVVAGKQIGHLIIGGAEALYATSVVAQGIATAGTNSVASYIPFVGASTGAIKGIVEGLAPLFYTLFMAMLVMGLLLAYWLPAIPMVLWIFGMVGWLIMMIEAAFAAIVWIAAHAIPEGDGWAGTHARAGYTLVLGLFMRPPLMIAGFFSAMLVMHAAGQIVGVLYPAVLVGADITSLLGIIGFLASMAILTLLLLVTSDRSYSLIHVVPDKVMRWISGPMENLGESEDNNRTRVMMAGVMGRFEGVARSGARQGATTGAPGPSSGMQSGMSGGMAGGRSGGGRRLSQSDYGA